MAGSAHLFFVVLGKLDGEGEVDFGCRETFEKHYTNDLELLCDCNVP